MNEKQKVHFGIIRPIKAEILPKNDVILRVENYKFRELDNRTTINTIKTIIDNDSFVLIVLIVFLFYKI